MANNDEFDSDEFDDQIEQMIVENGLLLHAVVNLLVRKGVLRQEDIDAEMDKMYAELEDYDDDSGGNGRE